MARTFSRFRLTPFGVVAGILTLATLLLVIYPLTVMVGNVFIKDGSIQFGAFVEAFGEPNLGTVLRDTFILVVISGFFSLLIATAFAWLMERTNARLGWAAQVFPMLPLMVPALAGAVGWMSLLAAGPGLLNVVIRSVLNAIGLHVTTGPFDIESWPGLIFLYTLSLVPFAYIILAPAFRGIDPGLEEASRVGGASIGRTFFRVTLPAIRHALAAAAVMILIVGLAMFALPVTIGSSPRIEPLSVLIYRMLTEYPARTETAVVLSLLMLLVVSIAWWVQRRITRQGRHSVIGGRSSTTALINLGRGRLYARLGIWLFVLATSVLPVGGMVILSLQTFWSARPDIQKFGLTNYQSVFNSATLWESVVNSVRLGIIGGVVAMLIAVTLGLYVLRSPKYVGRVIDATTRLPATLPHLVIAVAFISAFAGPPFNLHGTEIILLLAYLVMYIPQAAISANAALAQVGNDMTEASRVSGAGNFRTVTSIVLPLIWPGFIAGFALIFVIIAGETTGSAILAGINTPVVGFAMISEWQHGSLPVLAALATMVTIIFTLVVALALWVGRDRKQQLTRARRRSLPTGGTPSQLATTTVVPPLKQPIP
jgi:iron(III) transport system permease protein